MSNPKKKSQRRKTRPAKAASQNPKPKRSVPRPPVSRQLVHDVCGLTDPFCSHALTAKTPDNAGVRSLSYPIHSRFALTTDVNGAGSLLYLPNYTYGPVQTASSIGAGIAVFGTAMTAAPRLSNVTGYRISSFGVIIRRVSAPLTTSGMLFIRGFSNKTGVSFGTVPYAAYNNDFQADVALQDAKEVAIVGKRLDPTSTFFHPPGETTPSSAIPDWVSPGWGAFCITVTGGPASTDVLDVELFLNMEVTFTDDETLAILATPAPTTNPVVVNAVNSVSSQAKSVFLEGARQVATWTIQAASRAVMTAIGSRFGMGPSALALTVD